MGLVADLQVAANQIAEELASLGYRGDYSVDSLRDIDRFFDENIEAGKPKRGGEIARSGLGHWVFGSGAYLGEVLLRLYGGEEPHPDTLQTSFTEVYDELVVLRDIPFNSMCEHHLMPFEGVAHIAYLPDGKIVGISKLARVVDAFSRRPQVQERLTNQIADILNESLAAKGVAVVMKATHTCMTCRGVKKSGSVMVTSSLRGRCKSDGRTRSEVMMLLGSDGA